MTLDTEACVAHLTQRKVLHLLSALPKTNKYTTINTTTTLIDFVIDFVRISQVRQRAKKCRRSIRLWRKHN